MSYLVDSDWTVSFLDGQANAVELVGKLANDGIALSVITCGEVLEDAVGRHGSAAGKSIHSLGQRRLATFWRPTWLQPTAMPDSG